MMDTKIGSGCGPGFGRDGSRGHWRTSGGFAAVVVAAAAQRDAASGNVSDAAGEQSVPSSRTEMNHQSRRNAWIKVRWKAAFHTVRTIGSRRKLDEVKSGQRDEAEADSTTDDGVAVKKKLHSFVVCYQHQRSICAVCDNYSTRCGDEKDSGEDCPEEEDDLRFLKCQYCQTVIHRGCANSVTGLCQAAAQKPRFLLRKQKSTTPEDYSQQLRFNSAQGEEDDDDGALRVPASYHNQQQQPTVVVDPIYLALKEANRMASTRRVSVASSPSPVGANACSPRDLTPSDSMRELTVNRMAWCKMPSSASATSYGSSSGYGSTTAANHGSTKSLRNSPARMQSVSSTPSLFAQKSVESQEAESRRPSVAAPTPSASSSKAAGGQRRPPKLDSKLKSLSLDCPDAKVRCSKGATASGYSPVGRRVLKVRPCKNSSFDVSDDGADPSSTSCSPCPSPYCGSTLTLPSSSYAVTHDYHAKFPEEIDLGVGERVLVFETGDPDWWQGQNILGRIGIFPSTCVAHIHSNERVMQVVQNLNLWDGSKSLRLYRDQIVFAQQAEPDGLVEIRTEHDHRINCPVQYLMDLD